MPSPIVSEPLFLRRLITDDGRDEARTSSTATRRLIASLTTKYAMLAFVERATHDHDDSMAAALVVYDMPFDAITRRTKMPLLARGLPARAASRRALLLAVPRWRRRRAIEGQEWPRKHAP